LCISAALKPSTWRARAGSRAAAGAATLRSVCDASADLAENRLHGYDFADCPIVGRQLGWLAGMDEKPVEDLAPHDRRGFFRTGMARLLGPLAEYVEKKLPIDLPAAVTMLNSPGARTILRPPGARPEPDFLNTCYRCGRCAEACPADAIDLLRSDDVQLKGTPYIEPDRQACVICDDLACMKVCPSGALQLVGRLEIRMGLARVDHEVCVRPRGESCTECIDKCPLGSTALRLDESGRVQVIDPAASGEGCTGCGVCQQVCPTRPQRAIRVLPR